MITKQKPIILIIPFLVLLIFGFAYRSLQKIEAGPEHNVSGFSWSGNIGWTSFNNLSGGGNINYGVNLDPETGVFSGYAWSENIGWISFNENELSGCPIPPCRAWVDFSTNKIYGWAKVLAGGSPLAGGWDGWIKLRGFIQERGGAETTNEYGAWLDTSTRLYEIMGWGWGGDDNEGEAVVGWVSFNCRNPQHSPDLCKISNFKVTVNIVPVNQPPTVSEPRKDVENYCSIGPGKGQISFSWLYQDPNGDPQSEYHLQVATDPNFSNLAVNCTTSQQVSSGKRGSASVIVTGSPSTNCQQIRFEIGYNTTYYWRIKVKDSRGAWSEEWATGTSFTTTGHPWPWVDFSWNPLMPNRFEEVFFSATSSIIWTPSATYNWTFQGGQPSSSGTGITVGPIYFPETCFHNVTLTITDGDGYSCIGTAQVPVEHEGMLHIERYAPYEIR